MTTEALAYFIVNYYQNLAYSNFKETLGYLEMMDLCLLDVGEPTEKGLLRVTSELLHAKFDENGKETHPGEAVLSENNRDELRNRYIGKKRAKNAKAFLGVVDFITGKVTLIVKLREPMEDGRMFDKWECQFTEKQRFRLFKSRLKKVFKYKQLPQPSKQEIINLWQQKQLAAPSPKSEIIL
ncbi:MAG: hypothetical protein KGJ07_03660 [Patescibacteria group bacterium]|nr:hypothetical protein [Patescibacteria group bacterium]